ncbi:hypothetical protein [Nostoc sp.]|uniref:hypothetical protein n=1 Tax=Nostoc sp. TaxID=1180 RepID=UPI002FF904AB
MLLNYKKAIASSLLTLCSLRLCGSLKRAIALFSSSTPWREIKKRSLFSTK